jgi:hypothetical protein
MQQIAGVGPGVHETRPVCRAAAASFAVGLVALRVCWLPGVNCVLAAVSIALGGDCRLADRAEPRGAVRGKANPSISDRRHGCM